MSDIRVSSFCTRGECVAVTFLGGGLVEVGSTRDSVSGTVIFTCDEWAAFVAGVKSGEFDVPEEA